MSPTRFSRSRGCLVLAALLAGATAPAHAQKLPVRVSGVVMDSSLTSPLPGVIVLLDTGERTRTDARGRFTFEGLAPGVHRILILGTGCRASVAEFDAGTDPNRPKRIAVSASFSGGESVDPQSEPPRDSPGRVVTAAEIRDMGAGTMVDVLRRVAPTMVGGPAGQVGAATRLMGRGGRTIGDARVPILVVDGLVLYVQDTSVLEAIRPGDVAWMEILPGAVGGWSFGTGATGGVIRIRTHRGSGVASEADPGDCLVAARPVLEIRGL